MWVCKRWGDVNKKHYKMRMKANKQHNAGQSYKRKTVYECNGIAGGWKGKSVLITTLQVAKDKSRSIGLYHDFGISK